MKVFTSVCFQTGEQPLKRVPARRKNESTLDDDDPQSASEEIAGVALYAAHQTTLYRPPPVVNGRIPKNVYGNLDIYVPSMVPAGGSHITHPETARAARVLGIDHAQAVTGFEFKGRHGTAVISGAVVASEYCQAIQEVIEGFDDDKAREEEVKRSVEALRAWKRLLTALRIKERVEGYEIEGERKFADEGIGRINDRSGDSYDEDDEENDDDYNSDEGGGGFFPDRMVEINAEPTARLVDRYHRGDGEMGGGFLAEDSLQDAEGGFNKADDHFPRGFIRDRDLEDYDQDAGGGCVTGDGSDENNDQNQDIKPSLYRFGTGMIEDQFDDVHIERNLSIDYSEQLTHRTEGSKLLSGGGSERDGGDLISENNFSTAAIHAAAAVGESETGLPHIPSVDFYHIATTLEEDDEHEITAERGTTMQLTTPAPHSGEEASDHLSEPAAAAYNTTKSRNEQESQSASTPIQLSTSPQNPPPSRTADEHPPPSRDNDELMLSSQPTMTAVVVQDQDDATSATEGEGGGTGGSGGWNNSSDDEDAESLLSHDPEDEDADPEWLA